VYRGMDVGTAKPTAKQRAEVPHHLIDILDPSEEFSVAGYVAAAERAVREIAARGRPALFVGGSPLYLKALLRGIFEGPPADWPLRRRLAEEARCRGEGWLHARLAAVDPAAAARLHPNDARRLIRAIEVFEKTGRPISEWQRQFDRGRNAEECRVFTLDWPKAALHARIEQRVEEMFADGLVEEVRRLVGEYAIPAAQSPHTLSRFQRETGERLSRTARQAVGYREVLEYLEGRRSLGETIELVKRHTRQLAKRQNTWFRSLSECRFIAIQNPFDAAETAERCRRAVL